MRLHELCHGLGKIDGLHDEDLWIGRIDYDSRSVDEESLFMALSGRNTSGAAYIEQALARGAVAIGLEHGQKRPKAAETVVWFDNCRRAMATLAARVAGYPQDHLSLVAVTGTNGKTSVTTLVHDILTTADVKTGLIGTIETRIGARVLPAQLTTPEAPDLYRLLAEMRDQGVEVVCAEYSSVGIEEQRVLESRPRIAVYLNLSQDHLDYHGTMDAYGRAKAKLFTEHLVREGTAFVAVDDDFGRALCNEIRDRRPDVQLLTVSTIQEDADIFGEFVDASAGLSGHVTMREASIRVNTRLLGSFNRQNITMAAAVASALGVAHERISDALQTTCIPGRLEELSLANGPRVFIDYAHTPDALAAALSTIRTVTAGQLFCVFGCGGDRDRSKRPLMAQAATIADVIVVTSDNPRSEDPYRIMDEVVLGLPKHLAPKMNPDRRAAIFHVLDEASRNDTVLIAGKGHENYQEINGIRHPFSDRECVREWSTRRADG